MTEKILVVKLGALGDFMYALGPMRAIRARHPQAHITLLTQKPYAGLAEKTGFFDAILLDPRPKYNPRAWLNFRGTLNRGHFSRVYDLQNNDRSELYFKLFSPRPEWVGIAHGASHRNTDPDRRKFHAFLGHRQSLKLAGISQVDLDPLDWVTSNTGRFGLAKPYVLIVPGSSKARPNKKWPENYFSNLIEALSARNFHCVLIGSESERDICARLSSHPSVTDLSGLTTLDDLPGLARDAALAVGNDTGPMHIVSMTGCPSIFFFRTDESTVQKHGPQSQPVKSFEAKKLEDIKVDDVLAASLALARLN